MANYLTIARILLVIPFTVLFLTNAAWNMNAALAVFVLAALTDFLDGYVARTRGETSALGAALDPIADKLLVAAALLLLTRNGVIHSAGVVAALLILLREIFVGGLREALAARGAALPVTGAAKFKTMMQLVAVAFLIAAAPGGLLGESARPLASGLLWFATILTLWTGADYTGKAVKILRA